MRTGEYSKHGIYAYANERVAVIGSLLGMVGGEPHPLQGMSGLYRLQDESGLYDGKNMKITDFSVSEDGEGFCITYENEITRLVNRFSYRDGVWSRKDRLENKQAGPSVIYCCQSRFLLFGDLFDVMSQDGAWSIENQGCWKELQGGGLYINNMGLRTTEGAQPFLAIREKRQNYGIAFNIIPVGQWEIRVNKAYTSYCAMTVLDMGLAERGLHFTLEAGESIDLPEILFYGFHPADQGLGCARLHEYLLKNVIRQKPLPVLWNSWFFDFDRLDFAKFKREAETAAEIGCEYYVVDAGWFGDGAEWILRTGDWIENTNGAFFGKMKELSDFVRSKSMKFGLWMEPERAVTSSHVYKQHPDWFLEVDGVSALLDLGKPEPVQYIYDTVQRLVSAYQLEYMKLDFNMTVNYDKGGSSFYRYYCGYYELIRKLKQDFPQVYFEACASGGLRTDIHTVCASDCHFLTDTVNPLDMLRIMEGALLRLPARTLSKWYCCQEVRGIARPYGHQGEEPETRLMSCADGTWDRVMQVGADFMETLCLTGPLGFTSKLSTFSPAHREALKKTVALFKKERSFIEKAVCRMLTGPRGKFDVKSDTFWQFTDPEQDRSLLFCFHTEYPQLSVQVKPEGLISEASYRVQVIGNYITPGFDECSVATGRQLLENGILVRFSDFYSGRIIEIQRI